MHEIGKAPHFGGAFCIATIIGKNLVEFLIDTFFFKCYHLHGKISQYNKEGFHYVQYRF